MKIPFWHYTVENCGDVLNYDTVSKENGSLVDYVSRRDERLERIEWRDNFVFEATLEVTDYSRGRSAANFNLQDAEGHNFNCFMHSIVDIMRDPRFAAGKITARWTFEKRGQNYGIVLAQ